MPSASRPSSTEKRRPSLLRLLGARKSANDAEVAAYNRNVQLMLQTQEAAARQQIAAKYHQALQRLVQERPLGRPLAAGETEPVDVTAVNTWDGCAASDATGASFPATPPQGVSVGAASACVSLSAFDAVVGRSLDSASSLPSRDAATPSAMLSRAMSNRYMDALAEGRASPFATPEAQTPTDCGDDLELCVVEKMVAARVCRIFKAFDDNCNGFWSLDDLRVWGMVCVAGIISPQDFAALCERFHADPARGLELCHVVEWYSCDFDRRAVDAHYAACLALDRSTPTAKHPHPRPSSQSKAKSYHAPPTPPLANLTPPRVPRPVAMEGVLSPMLGSCMVGGDGEAASVTRLPSSRGSRLTPRERPSLLITSPVSSGRSRSRGGDADENTDAIEMMDMSGSQAPAAAAGAAAGILSPDACDPLPLAMQGSFHTSFGSGESRGQHAKAAGAGVTATDATGADGGGAINNDRMVSAGSAAAVCRPLFDSDCEDMGGGGGDEGEVGAEEVEAEEPEPVRVASGSAIRSHSASIEAQIADALGRRMPSLQSPERDNDDSADGHSNDGTAMRDRLAPAADQIREELRKLHVASHADPSATPSPVPPRAPPGAAGKAAASTADTASQGITDSAPITRSPSEEDNARLETVEPASVSPVPSADAPSTSARRVPAAAGGLTQEYSTRIVNGGWRGAGTGRAVTNKDFAKAGALLDWWGFDDAGDSERALRGAGWRVVKSYTLMHGSEAALYTRTAAGGGGASEYFVKGDLHVASEAVFLTEADVGYRPTWDPRTKHANVIASYDGARDAALHWRVAYPRPFSDRDYTMHREHRFSERVVATVSKHAPLLDVPERGGCTRVQDFVDYTLLLPSPRGAGWTTYLSFRREDPKCSVPAAVANWAMSTALPQFMDAFLEVCATPRTAAAQLAELLQAHRPPARAAPSNNVTFPPIQSDVALALPPKAAAPVPVIDIEEDAGAAVAAPRGGAGTPTPTHLCVTPAGRAASAGCLTLSPFSSPASQAGLGITPKAAAAAAQRGAVPAATGAAAAATAAATTPAGGAPPRRLSLSPDGGAGASPGGGGPALRRGHGNAPLPLPSPRDDQRSIFTLSPFSSRASPAPAERGGECAATLVLDSPALPLTPTQSAATATATSTASRTPVSGRAPLAHPQAHEGIALPQIVDAERFVADYVVSAAAYATSSDGGATTMRTARTATTIVLSPRTPRGGAAARVPPHAGESPARRSGLRSGGGRAAAVGVDLDYLPMSSPDARAQAAMEGQFHILRSEVTHELIYRLNPERLYCDQEAARCRRGGQGGRSLDPAEVPNCALCVAGIARMLLPCRRVEASPEGVAAGGAAALTQNPQLLLTTPTRDGAETPPPEVLELEPPEAAHGAPAAGDPTTRTPPPGPGAGQLVHHTSPVNLWHKAVKMLGFANVGAIDFM